VRYTVPAHINPARVEKLATVRFRVDNIYRDTDLTVYFDEEQVAKTAKKIMAPGEMETLRLPGAWFEKHPGCRTITVALEARA
jgi:hypothetical protein